jgi:carbamoyl-phosphate synthase large subunit
LENAVEVDVDALCDGEEVLIGGIMEHIEEAGVHSGDSSCVLPAATLTPHQIETIKDYTVRLALRLNVIGLMNVQYAIANGIVYVLEVNPRASRTVPYVSKSTGVPLAKIAVGLMLGRKLADYGLPKGVLPVEKNCVKSPVFPFNKFPGVDPILGPEMRSTGEVMGIGETFGEAFSKAQLSAGQALPDSGSIFISISARQWEGAAEVARKFAKLGFSLFSTRGTAQRLRNAGLECKTVLKVNEGRPNLVDLIKGRQVDLIINTPAGAHAFHDEKAIRRAAVQQGIPCITTLSAARAAADGITARREGAVRVRSLQELHAGEPVA